MKTRDEDQSENKDIDIGKLIRQELAEKIYLFTHKPLKDKSDVTLRDKEGFPMKEYAYFAIFPEPMSNFSQDILQKCRDDKADDVRTIVDRLNDVLIISDHAILVKRKVEEILKDKKLLIGDKITKLIGYLGNIIEKDRDEILLAKNVMKLNKAIQRLHNFMKNNPDVTELGKLFKDKNLSDANIKSVESAVNKIDVDQEIKNAILELKSAKKLELDPYFKELVTGREEISKKIVEGMWNANLFDFSIRRIENFRSSNHVQNAKAMKENIKNGWNNVPIEIPREELNRVVSFESKKSPTPTRATGIEVTTVNPIYNPNISRSPIHTRLQDSKPQKEEQKQPESPTQKR